MISVTKSTNERPVVMFPLEKITREGVQTRASTDRSWVSELAAIVREGNDLEPATVFQDGETYYLPVGNHRFEGYAEAGRDEMPVYIVKGTKGDAIRFGILENLQHRGMPLTRADKRHAAKMLLELDPSQSDRTIAKHCGASHTLVATCRKELEATGKICQSVERTGADSRTRRVPQPKEDFCSCGGRWESSGDGWRFCLECKSTHPDDKCPDEDTHEQKDSIPAEQPTAANSTVGDHATSNYEPPTHGDGEPPAKASVYAPVEVREKPPAKPLPDSLKEVLNLLGRALRAIDKLKPFSRGRHKELCDLISPLFKAVDDWREEEVSGLHRQNGDHPGNAYSMPGSQRNTRSKAQSQDAPDATDDFLF